MNQLAGGRALTRYLPQPHLALDGVAQPLVLQQLRGSVATPIDYKQLAAAVSNLKIYTRTSDTKAALAADAYTRSMSDI
jgi:hypothetical protein